MNTLPKNITAQIFGDSSSYEVLRVHWSQLMNSDRRHELSAVHHLLYSTLLGKDWRKGFSPMTNPRKLANGAFYSWKLFRALWQIQSEWQADWLLAPFDGLVNVNMLRKLRQLMPTGLHKYSHDDFASGSFPFEAYSVPEGILPLAAG